MKELYCMAAVESGFGASRSSLQNFFLDFERRQKVTESMGTEAVTFKGMLSDPIFRAELRDHIVVNRHPKGKATRSLRQLTGWVNTPSFCQNTECAILLYSHTLLLSLRLFEPGF